MAADGFAAYEAYVADLMQTYQLPGCAVALAEGGRTVYARGFGFRDRERGLPATPQTVFGIGSITKSFTAAAIMRLQEDGRLTVRDPITSHLPEFVTPNPAATRRITIHHLLTHTAGLPPLPSLHAAMARSTRDDPALADTPRRAMFRDVEPVDDAEQLMAFMGRTRYRLLGAPGEYFSYSNDSWALLGAIVTRVSGRPYEAFVREEILEPAGLGRTVFGLDELARLPEVTTLYAPRAQGGREDVVAAPRWWESPAMAAAGFIKSNVEDLLRYLEIYRTGGCVGDRRIISPSGVAAMTSPHTPAAVGAFYGYGFSIRPDYHGLTLVEHSGGLKGISAHVTWVPERDLTAAFLSNLEAVPAGQFLLGALNVRLGLPVDTRRQAFSDAPCPAERLSEYAGTFASGEGATLGVSVAGAHLACDLAGKPYTARPVAPDTFSLRVKADEQVLRFLRRADGAVWAVQHGSRIIRRTAAA